MKTKILLFTTILIFAGCNANALFDNNDKEDENTQENYLSDNNDEEDESDDCRPREIPYDEVLIINSAEDFKNYFNCYGNCRDIDFSKYTLLLANGVSHSGIVTIENQLQQVSEDEYNMCVYITVNVATFMQKWSLTVQVPKLSESAKVNLIVSELPNY